MPPDPPEPMDSDVARIFANGSTSTTQAGCARSPVGHRDLHPAVSGAEHLRQRKRHQADEHTADRRLEHPAAGQPRVRWAMP